MIYLRGFMEELRIGFEEAWNYRMNFFSEVINMLLLYFSLIVMNSGSSLKSIYSNGKAGSRELMLIGYILWNFSNMAMNTMSSTVVCEATSGTLEHKYMSIIPIEVLNVATFVQSFILEVLIIAIILIISKVFLDVSIAFNITSIIILLITLIGMYGIGLILGGIALKEKKIGKIVFFLQIFFLFSCDTVAKTSNKVVIKKLIPLTLGNDLVRESITYGNISLSKLCILILTSLIWLTIGIMVFKIFENKAKRDGKLGYY